MNKPVFPDKSTQPTAEELSRVLGKAVPLLEEIEAFLEASFDEPRREWKFYSKAAGWTVAVRAEKRTVFHLLPGDDFFTVVFTLGKRAVSAAMEVGLPESISSLIIGARMYAEGRSFRFVVSNQSDVDSVLKLVVVKLAK